MAILHAVVLIAMVAGTGSACVRYRSPLRWANALAGLFAAAIFAVLLGISGLHMCRNGNPLAQWLIPAVCLGFAIAVLRRGVLKALVIALLILVGCGLTGHYVALVHGETYVGTRAPPPPERGGPYAVWPEWHSWLTGLYRKQ